MAYPIPYNGDVTLALDCASLDASIAWYEGVLGFKLLYRLEAHGWCEMSGPTKNITIGLGQTAEATPKGGCTPVWGVKDIDEARKWLESRDVRFDGATREIAGMVKLATFYDPDGNAWMLAQSLRQPS